MILLLFSFIIALFNKISPKYSSLSNFSYTSNLSASIFDILSKQKNRKGGSNYMPDKLTKNIKKNLSLPKMPIYLNNSLPLIKSFLIKNNKTLKEQILNNESYQKKSIK